MAELAGRPPSARAAAAAASRLDDLNAEIRAGGGRGHRPAGAAHPDVTARDGRRGAPLWRLVDFVDGIGDARPSGSRGGVGGRGHPRRLGDAGRRAAVRGTARRPPSLRRTRSPAGLADVLRPAATRGPAAAPCPNRSSPRCSRRSGSAISGAGLGGHGRPVPRRCADRRLAQADRRVHRARRPRGRRGSAQRPARRVGASESELAQLGRAEQGIAERRARTRARSAGLPGDTGLRQAHAAVRALRTTATAGQTPGRRARTRRDARPQAAELRADRCGRRLHGTRACRRGRAAVEVRAALATVPPRPRRARGPPCGGRRREPRTAENRGPRRGRVSRSPTSRNSRTAEQESAAAAERHADPAGTVGAAVAELERQLREIADLLSVQQSEKNATGDRGRAAIDARGKATGQRGAARRTAEGASPAAAAAAESLRRFAATGLLAVALPELGRTRRRTTPWAPDPAMRLARRVSDDLADVDDSDSAWERVQRGSARS